MSRFPTSVDNALTGIGYWLPFVSRTALYGLASCVGGPFTGGDFSRVCMKRWCTDTLSQLRIDVKTEGLENVNIARPAIFVCNHVSVLDILVLGAILDVDYKWAAKRSLFRVPFLGWHLKIAGHIPVDRQKINALRDLEDAFARTLEGGSYLLVFPEGTRSPDGVLRPFRMGAFVTAVRHGIPVIPMAIEGTEALMEKGAWSLEEDARRFARVRILPPLTPSQTLDPRKAAERLRDESRALMKDALEDLRGQRTRASVSPVAV